MGLAVQASDDALHGSAEEPPDTHLRYYKSDESNLPLFHPPSSLRADARNPVSGPVLMTTRSVASNSADNVSELSTPKLATSPSYTDSTMGSPCSMSSMASYASSMHRGDYADVEDFDPEHELETVSEVDEIDTDSLASLDIAAESASDHEEHTPMYHSYTHGLRRIAEHEPATNAPEECPAPTEAHEDDTMHAPTPLRKGRVFEIMSDGDEMARSLPTLPSESGESGAGPEREVDLLSLPPILPPNLTVLDTAPAVSSPLATCVPDAHESSTGRTPLHAAVSSLRPQVGSQSCPGSARGSGHSSPSVQSRSSSRDTMKRKLKSALCSRSDSQRGRHSPSSHCVRFSTNPPVELRTHSPDLYDRKPCLVNNKLGAKDLDELRNLSLPMGLLEARWKTLRGMRSMPTQKDSTAGTSAERTSFTRPCLFRSQSETALPPQGPSTLPMSVYDANQGTSTPAPAETAPESLPSQTTDPLQDLQKMHAQRKEALQPSSPQQRTPCRASPCTLGSTLAARFGLNRPPPPLPGMEATPPISSRSADHLPAPVSISSSHRGFASTNDKCMPPPPPLWDPNTSHDLANGYESPATELYDSGSEYDLVA